MQAIQANTEIIMMLNENLVKQQQQSNATIATTGIVLPDAATSQADADDDTIPLVDPFASFTSDVQVIEVELPAGRGDSFSLADYLSGL